MKNDTLKRIGLAAAVLSTLSFAVVPTAPAGPRPQFAMPTPRPVPQFRVPEPRVREVPEQRSPVREPEQQRLEPENKPRNIAPQNRLYNNIKPDRLANLGVDHQNTAVSRPTAFTPAMRHAMNYNTRPGGVHINPEFFSAHYGRAHGFHFTNYAGGPCIGDCGLRVFRGEWYFERDGGWFGIMGLMPGNWGFQTDYLYIGMGDDGNYYLYDAQFPDESVQLTFVQNIGDDQAGADQDQDDQREQSQQ
jgi:hypothetical protein